MHAAVALMLLRQLPRGGCHSNASTGIKAADTGYVSPSPYRAKDRDGIFQVRNFEKKKLRMCPGITFNYYCTVCS